MTADSELDFDDAPMDEDEDEELDFDQEEGGDEEPGGGRNPLRIILLVLLILVLLCVLCFLAGRFLPIPGIPGISPGEPPTAPPVADTPTLELPTEQPPEEPTPTEVSEVPAPEEPTPTEESEMPAPEEPTPTGAPEEPTPTEEGEMPPPEEPTPTEEGQPPATEEPVEEPPTTEPTATTEPAPGPTSTPTPGEPGQANCDANIPPVADAGDSYEAMMGKGQAVVNFDGSGSMDPDGTIESYEWDFGDNSAPASGQTVSHMYGSTGSFVARLTVTDNCGATSEDTADVTIVGPTPPANGTATPATPAPSPPPSNPPPADATLGFCHLVQRGETLSGLAAAYGVPWPTLAEVNGVGPGYFVIAGQGLFIPTSQVKYGPNVYEVQSGDTLSSVAGQCGLTANILARVNNLNPGAGLSPGQFLVIPPWRQVYP